jgi:hypothetical protein
VKNILRPVVISYLLLFSVIGYSQTSYINLTSSDFIKGLEKKDALREKLVSNGFKMVSKNLIGTAATAFYESWQYENFIYVDIIYNPRKENTIKVGVHETYKGFSERLLQTFPKKGNDYREESFSNVNVAPINKKISYLLDYNKDNYRAQVLVWYDTPYYFFEYIDEKLR